ncbi:MAG: EAL domain-containing protein [Gammaproteobacteria bacterium]
MHFPLPSPGLVMALFALALLTGELASETLLRQHFLAREQEHALATLNGIRARLEKVIYRDLYVVRALATHVADTPDIGQAGFARYAERLIRRPTTLRHVTAAPGLVMRYVYPERGNEAVIGKPYADYPEQFDAVSRAAAGRGLVITGPVALIQGGSAFIAREAVLLPTPEGPPRLWGLVSAAIDSDKLYRAIGLTAADGEFEFALRAGMTGEHGPPRVFYGRDEVFDALSVSTVVNLPNGHWELATRPRAGWLASTPPAIWLLRGVAVALGLLSVVLLRARSAHLAGQSAALAAVGLSAQALRRSQQDLVNAIESLAEGFALWDQDDHLKLYNQRLLEILPALDGKIRIGMSFEDLIRRMAALGVVGDEDREAWIAQRLAQHGVANGELEVRTRAGRTVTIAERRTPDGHVVALYTDVTLLRAAEADVRYRAFFDVLTGLPNREHFMNQLRDAIAQAARGQAQFALLFLDLDRFKLVNDTFGHEQGDRLLIEAARRLRACVRHSDMVARFGGDEFTVLLRDVDDGINAAHSAEAMIAALGAPFELEGRQVHGGASVGIALYPTDGVDAHTLLRNADLAMYRAKARGRNTVRFYAEEMRARVAHAVALERDLRDALARGEFFFEYQPVVRIADGVPLGAEALLRWRHPERGVVPPAEFIPMAEETRLIERIGPWALARACEEARDWPGAPRLAVNVSPRQLWSGFDGAQLRTILAASGFPAERLVLELTESVLLDGERRIARVLQEFRALGVDIALDDFGTGWSAFGYLRRFPVSMLKIDRGFVARLESGGSDTHLVAAIVALGRALDLSVVAEGVENAAQAAILDGMGCEFAQGYYFGAPMAAADVAARLAQVGSG